MEIEVGEFVRTAKGIIYKYNETIKKDIQLQDFLLCNNGRIVKHSKQLIDLIEEGDYVNGEKIKMNYEAGELRNIPRKIKTILTHEQFKKNVFRVEE